MPSEQREPAPAAAPPAQAGGRRVWEWALVVLVLAVGIGLRAAYLHELAREPDFAAPALDPQFHDYWARALVSGDWTPPAGMPDPKITTTPYGRPPLYPHVLALIYRVSDSYMAPRVVQMAVGMLNALLLYLLARRLFGRGPALIAAAMAATYWGFIFFEGELESPVFEIAVLLLLAHAAVSWGRSPALWKAALLGVLLGVFTLMRSNALACVPVLAAWVVVVAWRGGQLRRGLIMAGVTVGGAVIAIAPVTIRNFAASGEFVPITYNGGINLHIGNNPLTDCVLPVVPEMRELTGSLTWTCFHYPMMMRGIAAQSGRETISFDEADAYFRQKAWRYIGEHPGQSLGRVFKRALLFWHPTEITSNKVVHYAKEQSRTLRLMPGFALFFGLGLVGFAGFIHDALRKPAAGHAAFLSRTQIAVCALLVALALTYYATFLPFLVSGRFRVPLIPLLLLFGAYGIWRIGQLAFSRQSKPAAVCAAATVAAIAAAHVPFVHYEPEKDLYHYYRASAYERQGQLESAAAEYLLSAQAGNAEAAGGGNVAALPYSGLGRVMTALGKKDEAEKAYTAGLQVDPASPTMNNNLALLLADKQEFDKALPLYERALAVDANNARILNNQGKALAALGKSEEAEQTFQRAVALDPELAPAHAGLAAALCTLQKYKDAEEAYAKALALPGGKSLPPSLELHLEEMGNTDVLEPYYNYLFQKNEANVKARIDMGTGFVRLGMLDKAVATFEEALKYAPGDRDVLFNLGAVKESQGKADEAANYYRQLLQDDPKDAGTAARLGNLLARQKDSDGALALLQATLDAGGSPAILHTSMGNVLGAQGKWDDAIKQYEAALQAEPTQPMIWYNLGRAYEINKREDEAAGAYRKAVEAATDNPGMLATVIQALLRMGKRTEAAEETRKALEKNPENETLKKLLTQIGN